MDECPLYPENAPWLRKTRQIKKRQSSADVFGMPIASSAAWRYLRASFLNLYVCGLLTSCTFCGAVSRDDEQFEPE
jgi:hypothetical protein